MTPIETVAPESPESYQAHPNCRCTLSPTDDTQDATEETQVPSQEESSAPPESSEEAPPVSVRYDCSWNHDTGRVEWQRVEEPIKVTPRPFLEPAKRNRAGRRQLRRALWHIVSKSKRRKAKLQPAVCSRCMAPMHGLHLARYGATPEGEPSSTVVGHDFWQCQCQPPRERRARYECDMCHGELWQTDEERAQNTVCADCGEQLREQWQAETDSASEAMRRATALREEDDEMHRAAQEATL